MARRRAACLKGVLLLGSCLLGCAGYRPVNVPLEQWNPHHGYRATEKMAERGMGELAIVLAFSGGGTRAAALSFGVLQELRDTTFEVEGPDGEPETRRLLDEVDLITSVSGGSFTSAYYALHGDQIFEDYEERVLRRNITGQLIIDLLLPRNWLKLWSASFDRSELAVRLYDREFFDGATFADLAKTPGPFVQINAADIGVGNRFTFHQEQFDLLCSDLSKIEVARAVTASSAVPVAFSPITFRNYAGSCGFEPPAWLEEALTDRQSSRRRVWDAKITESYLDSDTRRYIHVVDGGIADNLGVRGPLDMVIMRGGIRQRLDDLGARRPRQLAVIVVDAEVHPEPEFSQSPASPSLAAIIGAVSGVQLYRYNFETVELLHASLDDWGQQLSADGGPPVDTHLVEVAFESIDDDEEREFFNEVPTSLSLDDETVSRLIEAGRRLLRKSPEFKEMLSQLRETGPASIAEKKGNQ